MSATTQCAICHSSGFGKWRNRPKTCKLCLRTVCCRCTTIAPIASLPLALQASALQLRRDSVRVCADCAAGLTVQAQGVPVMSLMGQEPSARATVSVPPGGSDGGRIDTSALPPTSAYRLAHRLSRSEGLFGGDMDGLHAADSAPAAASIVPNGPSRAQPRVWAPPPPPAPVAPPDDDDSHSAGSDEGTGERVCKHVRRCSLEPAGAPGGTTAGTFTVAGTNTAPPVVQRPSIDDAPIAPPDTRQPEPPTAAESRRHEEELAAVQRVLATQDAACRPASKLPWWVWASAPFTHALTTVPVPKTIGHAYVRVIEATNIVPWETHRLGGGTPSSNAFAEVALGQHSITAQTTRAILHSLSPAWDEAFMMAVQSPYANLRVTLWHHPGSAASGNSGEGFGDHGGKQPLGEVILPLSLFADGAAHDLWVNLRPCGARIGEEGINQILTLVDQSTGGHISVAMDGVKPRTVALQAPPPTAVLAAMPHDATSSSSTAGGSLASTWLKPMRPVAFVTGGTGSHTSHIHTAVFAPASVMTPEVTEAPQPAPVVLTQAPTPRPMLMLAAGGLQAHAETGAPAAGQAPFPPQQACAGADRYGVDIDSEGRSAAVAHVTAARYPVTGVAASVTTVTGPVTNGDEDPRSLASRSAVFNANGAASDVPPHSWTVGSPRPLHASENGRTVRPPPQPASHRTRLSDVIIVPTAAQPEAPTAPVAPAPSVVTCLGCTGGPLDTAKPRRRWFSKYRRANGSIDCLHLVAGVPLHPDPGDMVEATTVDAAAVIAPLLFEEPGVAMIPAGTADRDLSAEDGGAGAEVLLYDDSGATAAAGDGTGVMLQDDTDASALPGSAGAPAFGGAATANDQAGLMAPFSGSMTHRDALREHARLYDLYPRLAEASAERAEHAGEVTHKEQDVCDEEPVESTRTRAALATFPPPTSAPGASLPSGSCEPCGSGSGAHAPTGYATLPPLLSTDALVHDYGLGRIRLQVQLRYDPVAEFFGHMVHYEQPPVVSKPAYSAALLVHNHARLYALLAPPITRWLLWLYKALSWEDPVATLLLCSFIMLWSRHSWALPLLLHAWLLRHVVLGYVRLHLKRIQAALHEPFTSLPVPPTVAAGVAVVEGARIGGGPDHAGHGASSLALAVVQAAAAAAGPLLADAAVKMAAREPSSAGSVEMRGSLHSEPDSQSGPPSRHAHRISGATIAAALRFSSPDHPAGKSLGRFLASIINRAQAVVGSGSSLFDVITAPIVDDAAREQLRSFAMAVAARLLARVRDTRSSNVSFEPRASTAKDSRTTVAERLGLPNVPRPATSHSGRRAPGGQLVAVADVMSAISLQARPAAGTTAETRVGLPTVAEIVPPSAGTVHPSAPGAQAASSMSGGAASQLTDDAAANAAQAEYYAKHGPLWRLKQRLLHPLHPDHAGSGRVSQSQLDAASAAGYRLVGSVPSVTQSSSVATLTSACGGQLAINPSAARRGAVTSAALNASRLSLIPILPTAPPAMGMSSAGGLNTALQPASTAQAGESPRSAMSRGASAPSYAVALGVAPLTVDVPAGAKLLLIAPNSVVHNTSRLAEAARRTRTGEAAVGGADPTSSAPPRSGVAGMLWPTLPAPPAAPAPGHDTGRPVESNLFGAVREHRPVAMFGKRVVSARVRSGS